jgi:hypothetical protein
MCYASHFLLTLSVSVDWLPAASFAVTVNILVPFDSCILEIDQDDVPLAVPLPPWELTQVTWLTPTLSEALPDKLMDDFLVLVLLLVVGDVILTTGAVVSWGGAVSGGL